MTHLEPEQNKRRRATTIKNAAAQCKTNMAWGMGQQQDNQHNQLTHFPQTPLPLSVTFPAPPDIASNSAQIMEINFAVNLVVVFA